MVIGISLIHFRKYFGLLILGCGFVPVMLAQKNIVPNGGLEKGKKGIFIASATGWKGSGTVDYYTAPLKNDPAEKPGALTGRAYAGLRFQWDYKEFMYVKLSEPLKAGMAYRYEMYIRLVHMKNVTYSLKTLSACFTHEPYKTSEVVDATNSVSYTESTGIIENYQWTEIGGTFIAQGGERYLTIGNFKPNIRKDFVKLVKFKPFIFHEAYYFIDDISLVEGVVPVRNVTVEKVVNVKTDTLAMINPDYKTGEVVPLSNIIFESASAVLLPASFDELDQLYELLSDNPKMAIQVNGHTDNQGDEKTNKTLSQERAKAVADYLVTKNIKNRIVVKGYGSSKPVAKNNTDEGRSLNRRVEFVILKQ